MKVAEKIKKLTGTDSGKAIEPFYIDEAARKASAKSSTAVLEKLNNVCQTWQAVTKKPIESDEEFKSIIEDPAKHWRGDKLEDNIEQKRPLTISYLDEGFEETAIAELIKLPADFERVFDAVKQLNKIQINWKNFTWVENGYQLSQYFLNWADGKIYFHAVTPLQQKRLARAKAVLAAIKDLEEIMIEEAQAAGVKQTQIERAIKEARHVGPLPYCLKFKQIPGSAYAFTHSYQEIAINEHWVRNGLSQWGDMIGLGKLNQRDRPTPKPHIPMVYLKFTRRDLDGAKRLYIIPKHSKDGAYFGMWRDAEVKFLPGEFIIDEASGKLVPNE